MDVNEDERFIKTLHLDTKSSKLNNAFVVVWNV